MRSMLDTLCRLIALAFLLPLCFCVDLLVILMTVLHVRRELAESLSWSCAGLLIVGWVTTSLWSAYADFPPMIAVILQIAEQAGSEPSILRAIAVAAAAILMIVLAAVELLHAAVLLVVGLRYVVLLLFVVVVLGSMV